MFTEKFTPEDVKLYYNKMTSSYMEIYGDVIQAFRPTETESLLDYIGRSAGINWNLKVLDLGCGVAGPAIHFAKRWNANVDGITISDIQLSEGIRKIKEEQLGAKINLYLGDYHHLEERIIPNNDYDVVLFLESLGHSYDVQSAIKNAYTKLKKGGGLYIKDFYKRQVENKDEQKKIDRVISNINKNYTYNTLNLAEVKKALKICGFEIQFIKQFDFIDDIKIRYEFELQNNIDIFEGQTEFYPADWLEIKCVKCNLNE